MSAFEKFISIGLWFVASAMVWNTLNQAQQALSDPDFRAQALLSQAYSVFDLHQLNQRRGVLGSHMRQFMQGFDLVVTPAVAVPAFDVRPAAHVAMLPESMLGWTPFSATPST